MSYLVPIKAALIIFPFLALLITLPYIIYEYHHYGSVNKLRTLIIYSFILYLITIYFLVILPLPTKEEVIKMKAINPQLIPLTFIKDIVEDLNRVVREKNACKLTINESLAKGMGFDIEMYKNDQQDTGLNELLVKLGAPQLEKDNYFSTSKNKNEIRFENNSKDILSSILVMIMQTWKQHIYYLNQQENRYLAELRDALIPDLMSGKIDVT